MIRTSTVVLLTLCSVVVQAEVSFERDIAPILQENCLACHNSKARKGELSFETAADLFENDAIVKGASDESPLIHLVTPTDGKAEMPQQGKPLSASEITLLRNWIDQGAMWPDQFTLKYDPTDWWSLNPIVRSPLPKLSREDRIWIRNPLDRFIAAARREKGLGPSPEADRRTLIRRLYFDLIGLPPSFAEVQAFESDERFDAYERLVDRLLASDHYGERWARHWLDLVHYGDTHGYDKDKLRNNAWPYRDYVIRSLNADKPYDQFIREQLAGDVIAPYSADGIIATGFIAAGPFDWVGQIELAEGTRDKHITRNLDRDDMVSVTMNAFASLTAQCARCHDHKFDPISQKDYYELQAVFAGIDRADRMFDADADVARQREKLVRQRDRVDSDLNATETLINEQAGDRLASIDSEMKELHQAERQAERPEFGYHSQIEAKASIEKWVQVDLGNNATVYGVVLAGSHDDFNGIGAGFGFPVRYKVELSDDAEFNTATTVVDRTDADVPNPGVAPQLFPTKTKARYIRVTATRLAERQNDYILALGELMAIGLDGSNLAQGKKVTSLDSIQAPARWARKNLVDGYYYGMQQVDTAAAISELERERAQLIAQRVDRNLTKRQAELQQELTTLGEAIAALPMQQVVYAAASNFKHQGNFKPTGGTPRVIHVLNRGDVDQPIGDPVVPGTVDVIADVTSSFTNAVTEGDRRLALAEWIADERNPLTWRSIVNRVWQYHFGRGIVASPNDFGRMGVAPSHPELLDWLAAEFRDGGDWIADAKSIKKLHRLIVTSSVYRQSSVGTTESEAIDGGNQLLWRMNRRRLEAEAIRDATLAVCGVLNRKLYGPGFQAFELEKPEHSPHYLYEKFDPSKSSSHRRTIYRFIVRSVPDPFMEVLDCADPSQIVARRSETITPLSALALLNDSFMIEMSKRFADRAESADPSLAGQVEFAWRTALGRQPSPQEFSTLIEHAQSHGLSSVCRLILNTNEFIFVD